MMACELATRQGDVVDGPLRWTLNWEIRAAIVFSADSYAPKSQFDSALSGPMNPRWSAEGHVVDAVGIASMAGLPERSAMTPERESLDDSRLRLHPIGLIDIINADARLEVIARLSNRGDDLRAAYRQARGLPDGP